MITGVNVKGFSPNLVCALILKRCGFGSLMDKFHQFWQNYLLVISLNFLFADDNLSKYEWIFPKLGMCIAIVVIWFGIVYGQISIVCAIFFYTKCLGTIVPKAGTINNWSINSTKMIIVTDLLIINPLISVPLTLPYLPSVFRHLNSLPHWTSTIFYPMFCLKIAG